MKRISLFLVHSTFIISCNEQSNQKERNIMTTIDINHVIDQYHKALNPFACGNAQTIKPLWSHRDDVTLPIPLVRL